MSKVLIELLEGLRLQFRGLWRAFLQELAKVGEIVGPLVAMIKEIKLEPLVEFLTERFALLILRVHGSDPGLEATRLVNRSLSEALMNEYKVISFVFLASIMTLAIFIALPLTYKALARSRLGVFISFNNLSRGVIAKKLARYLNAKKMIVYRLPFQAGAAHDDINGQVNEGIIEKCDCVVCLPGYGKSYVEYEVATATGARKPITLLISERNGTLPDTTTKSYPMFRLELTSQHQFRPLVTFLSHIGGDFSSTWYLCKKALCDPLTFGSSRRALLFGGICFLAVWASCAFDVIMHGLNLTDNLPEALKNKTPLILSHVVILSLLASIVLPICGYVFLFCRSLRRRFDAQRKARYESTHGQFKRDDWIGKIPGLDPGETLYECLFESALSTHREMNGKVT